MMFFRPCTRMARLPLALALVAAAWPTAAPGQVIYTIRDLGTLGGPTSRGDAINAAGQVTGYADTPAVSNHVHAFRTTVSGQVMDLSNGISSEGLAINALGQVAGYAFFNPSDDHAFRTTATGTLNDPGADLGTLGGLRSIGYGINASGQVAGTSVTAGGVTHAFRTTATGRVSDPGTDLGTLGGPGSGASGINDFGQVTGGADRADNTSHAFRTSATGRISDPGTDLGTLGGANSSGLAINNAGRVTGSADLPGNTATHAFRTTANGLVSDPGADLGVLLGFTSSEGWGINASGAVVGRLLNTNSQGMITDSRAFLFDSPMHDLNDLIPASSGWVLTWATGINDAGLITGMGTIDGQQHAFLLTPTGVPEPSSLLLTGAAVLGGWIVRRGRAGRVHA